MAQQVRINKNIMDTDKEKRMQPFESKNRRVINNVKTGQDRYKHNLCIITCTDA